MPILEMQRRLAEAGRIRAGQQVRTGGTRKDGRPATRPEKLDAWRFTSRNRRALDAAARIYGGEVQVWEDAPTGDQFELCSSAAELDVVLPPEQVAFSQWLELWSGGGCKRRCDGVSEQITGGPCVCDPDKPECDPHTRLSVMLAGAPTTGLWRVETKGHYAKAELGGAMDLAQLLTEATGRSMLPAKLRLEHRKVIREGKTRQFVVPVLDFAVDVAALAAGPGPAMLSAPAGPVAELSAPPSPVTAVVVDGPGPTFADQMDTVVDPGAPAHRRNSPPPIPATGLAPRTAAEADAAPPPPPAPAAAPAKKAAKRAPAAKKQAAPRPARNRQASPPDDEAPRIGEARVQELIIGCQEVGFSDREQRLRYISNVVGREVTTTKDLTPQEGNKLARSIHELKANEF